MNVIGFPIRHNYRFRLNGRLHRLNQDGTRVLDLLSEIYQASLSNRSPYWLLGMRKQIRCIEQLNTRAVLTHVIEKTQESQMRVLAIWLRGRCGGYMGTAVIAQRARMADLTTQKECVRALKRLHGWVQLAQIARESEHARVRELAVLPPAPALAPRLPRLLQHFQTIELPTERQTQWVQPGLPLSLSPPKRRERIQTILQRIRERLATHHN